MKPITLNPSAITRLLAVVEIILVCAALVGQLLRFVFGSTILTKLAIFYLDGEKNIPTFFSALMLIFAAALLVLITTHKIRQKSTYILHWVILSGGFLCLTFDELFQFHESLVSPVRSLLGGGRLGIFYFAWVIPAIVAVVILGLFFLRFVLHLPPKTRLACVLSAILFVGGAVGFEFVEGVYVELHGNETLTYAMLTIVEEALEMAGVIVFIRALLIYLSEHYPDVSLRFQRIDSVTPKD